MKIKSFSPLLQGEPVRMAELSTDDPSSSYGRPVLVVEGVGAMGQGDISLAGYRIIQASQEEADALRRAGYHIPPAYDGAVEP